MLAQLKAVWKDERGATTIVEVIGLSVIIAGAVALVGYGIAATMRGLAGSSIKVIKDADPNNP